MQERVAAGRVLLLGVGGAGSGVLQALVGAGVSHVRIVDVDVVEEKNLARQFCYGTAAVGARKVDAAAAWAAAYCPGSTVEPIHERISDADRVRELVRGVDVVVCAIDTPANAQQLVNAACMDLGVPFVTGGLQQSTLYYWSVEPNVSACRECLELHRADQLAGPEAALDAPALLTASHVNRGTGPVVQILAGLMALEALRYLSRHDPPVAAATYRWIALADAMSTGTDPWTSHPDCPYCRPRSGNATPPAAVLAGAP